MNTLTSVKRVDAREQIQYLKVMHNYLSNYHEAIQSIINLYQKSGPVYDGYDASWSVPLSAFVNFRDALCHYAAACHHEEAIQLLQDQNAIEEHLHRAVKDIAVNYLQVLGSRLSAVYQYKLCNEEMLPEGIPHVNSSTDVEKVVHTLFDEERFDDIPPFLHYFYVNFLSVNKGVLQKCIHKIRNFDLKTRKSSLIIRKPFKVDDPDGPLVDFFKITKDCEVELKKFNLYDTVYFFGEFFMDEIDEDEE